MKKWGGGIPCEDYTAVLTDEIYIFLFDELDLNIRFFLERE